MDHCEDHKECQSKIITLCRDVNKNTLRLDRVEADVEEIKEELWMSPSSIRQRVKGMEDQGMHLEKIILENRDVVSQSMKGMFKLFVLTVSAAALLIITAMGIMWSEIKSFDNKITQRIHYVNPK